jgi:ABC-2 type transport system permease protein
MDLLLWGFTGTWMQYNQNQPSDLKWVFILAPILWQVISRFTLEIPRNLLEEIWGGSMVNLLACPITTFEWLLGIVIVAASGMVVTLLMLTCLAWLLYSFNIFMLGWLLLPFMASLLLFGLILGFFCAGLVIYRGSRIGTIAWAMPWLFAPISGVFYPLEVLPVWIANIGRLFPPAYIFQAMREVLLTHHMPWGKLGMSFALSALYLPLSLMFFTWMFKKSCQRGLSRLVD